MGGGTICMMCCALHTVVSISTAVHCVFEARYPDSSSALETDMALVTLLLKQPVLKISSCEVAITASWVKL